jgi:hypothetical protein
MSKSNSFASARFVAGALVSAVLSSATAQAQLQVITVPWNGDPSQPH